jgi:hypothetical protein
MQVPPSTSQTFSGGQENAEHRACPMQLPALHSPALQAVQAAALIPQCSRVDGTHVSSTVQQPSQVAGLQRWGSQVQPAASNTQSASARISPSGAPDGRSERWWTSP